MQYKQNAELSDTQLKNLNSVIKNQTQIRMKFG